MVSANYLRKKNAKWDKIFADSHNPRFSKPAIEYLYLS